MGKLLGDKKAGTVNCFNFEFVGKSNRVIIEIQKEPALPEAVRVEELERFDNVLMTFEEVAEALERGERIPMALVNVALGTLHPEFHEIFGKFVIHIQASVNSRKFAVYQTDRAEKIEAEAKPQIKYQDGTRRGGSVGMSVSFGGIGR